MNILVIGATSAIAEEVCRIYARQGANLYLLARNTEKLETMASDLKVRGAHSVTAKPFDAGDLGSHPKMLEEAISASGHFDLVLIAHGSANHQAACEGDIRAMLRELTINALSVLCLLTVLANYFEARRQGTIAVISSVAGERGRGSNYVYGCAKGTVTLFMEGLRCRLYKSGVQVLTIKPGFVDTPMTRDFKKGPLWAKPEKVAKDIVRAIERKADVLYTPWFWAVIMTVITHIPTRIFKRLKL